MLKFQRIRWCNFLSTGNSFTEIDLLKHNTTLVTGSNGAGKTTLLDAIVFSLFGKPYRNINIPQLVNSINEKDCLVEIWFSANGSEYQVRRGVAPKIFEIIKDGKLIEVCANSKDYQKNLEEQILKFNLKSFCQVVILGSTNYVPFMRLTAADRRSIVESILDISIFSTMNILLKERQGVIKDKIREIDSGLSLIREKIDMQTKFIANIKSRSDSLISEKQEAINKTLLEIQNLGTQIDFLQKEASILLSSTEIKKTKEEMSLGKLNTLYTQINNNVRSLSNEIVFYEKNDVCPSCHQGICVEHKNKEVNTKQNKLQEMQGGIDDIKQRISETQEVLSEAKRSLELVQEKQGKINTLISSRVASEKHTKQLQVEITRIQTDRSDESSETEKLSKFKTMENDIARNKTDSSETAAIYTAAASILKDTGIKKKIISHYLPIINKTINVYLTKMNFFVCFELNENFEEKIKSRHRDEFTYDSFSEGEKRRIDLALLFAWRAIAAQKNSVNCNLLILDEILDGSLDDVATDAFLDILKTIDSSVRIYVISHKNPESLSEKFKNRMVFEKKNNFSVLTDYTN